LCPPHNFRWIAHEFAGIAGRRVDSRPSDHAPLLYTLQPEWGASLDARAQPAAQPGLHHDAMTPARPMDVVERLQALAAETKRIKIRGCALRR
jgi:hypothetical protein